MLNDRKITISAGASAVCGGRAPPMTRFLCITLLYRVALMRMCLTLYGTVRARTIPLCKCLKPVSRKLRRQQYDSKGE